MEILAALYAGIQFIDNLVQFGQIVEGLASPGANTAALAHELAVIEAALQGLVGEVQQCSVQILSAISQMDQQIFGSNMADKLSDADQAGIALALWQQEHADSAEQQALSTSEAGLAELVELYANAVFPAPSMVLVLARVLLSRLAVLGIFPAARTPADTDQLRAALTSLMATTNAIAAQIEAGNQIHVTNQTTTVPGVPHVHGPLTFTTVTVRYGNVLGDKIYNASVTRLSFQDAQVAAQPLLSAANQAQGQGLAEDLSHAQVLSLRQVIGAIQPVIG